MQNEVENVGAKGKMVNLQCTLNDTLLETAGGTSFEAIDKTLERTQTAMLQQQEKLLLKISTTYKTVECHTNAQIRSHLFSFQT